MSKEFRRNYKYDFKDGVCVFCQKDAEVDTDCGKFLTDKDGKISVHNYCLLFASGLSQHGEDHEGIDGFLIPDIEQEYRRGKRLRCSFCNKMSATIGCSNSTCKKCFHFSCGFKHEAMFVFFDTFLAYCKVHRPQQDVPSTDSDPSSVTCPICMDEVEARVSNHTLKTPCCNNTWFHRTCVQRQALSAGYFFRCAICNNQEQFQQEMKHFGIYIPEHDASWEKEDNAFQELYWRHDMCDIDPCKCPDGRKFNKASSKWELVLCDLCGSSGCHLACGGLKSVNQDWACVMCSAMLSNATEVNCPSACSPQKSPSLVVDSPTRTGQTTRTSMKLMGKHPRTPLSSQTFRKITPSPFSCSKLPNSTGERFDCSMQDICCSAHDSLACGYSGDSCFEPPDLSSSFDYCQPSTSSQGLEDAMGKPKKGKKRKLSFCSKENALGHSLNACENMHFKKHFTWKTQKRSVSLGLSYGSRTTCRMSMRPRNIALWQNSPLNVPVKKKNKKTTNSSSKNSKNICKVGKDFSAVPYKAEAGLLSVSLKQEVGHACQKVLTPVNIKNATVTKPVEEEPLSNFAATLSKDVAKRTSPHRVSNKVGKLSPKRQSSDAPDGGTPSLTEMHCGIPSTSGTCGQTKNALIRRFCVETQVQSSLQFSSYFPTDVLNHCESSRDLNRYSTETNPLALNQEADSASHDITGLLNLQQLQIATVTYPADKEPFSTGAATLSNSGTGKESPHPCKVKRKFRSSSPAGSTQPLTEVHYDIPRTLGRVEETENTLIETQVQSSSCIPTCLFNHDESPRDMNEDSSAISLKREADNASHDFIGLLSMKNNLEQLQNTTVTYPADEEPPATFSNDVDEKASALPLKVTSKVKKKKTSNHMSGYPCFGRYRKPRRQNKSTTPAGSMPPLTEVNSNNPSPTKVVWETLNSLIGRYCVKTQSQSSLQSTSCLPTEKSNHHESPRDVNENSSAVSLKQEADNASHDTTGLVSVKNDFQQLQNATVMHPADEEPNVAVTLSSDVAKRTLSNKLQSKVNVRKRSSPVCTYPGTGECFAHCCKKNSKRQPTDTPDRSKSPLTTLYTDIQPVVEEYEKSPVGRSCADAQAHPTDQSPICLPIEAFSHHESLGDLSECSAENFSFQYVWGGYDDTDHEYASPFSACDFMEDEDKNLAGSKCHRERPVSSLSEANEDMSCTSSSLAQQWSPYPSRGCTSTPVVHTKAEVHYAISDGESIREQEFQQPAGCSQELSTHQTVNWLQIKSTPTKPSSSLSLNLDTERHSTGMLLRQRHPTRSTEQDTVLPNDVVPDESRGATEKEQSVTKELSQSLSSVHGNNQRRVADVTGSKHKSSSLQLGGLETEGKRSEIEMDFDSCQDERSSHMSWTCTSFDAERGPVNQDRARHSTGRLLRRRYEKSKAQNALLLEGDASDRERRSEKERPRLSKSQGPNQDAVNLGNIITDATMDADVTPDETIIFAPPGDETEEPAVGIPSSVRLTSSTEASPDSGISQGCSCNHEELPITMMTDESTSSFGKEEIHSCSKQKYIQVSQNSPSLDLYDSRMNVHVMVKGSKNYQETDGNVMNLADTYTKEATADAKPTDFESVKIDRSPGKNSTISECTGSSITSVSSSTRNNPKTVSSDSRHTTSSSRRSSINGIEAPVSSPTPNMNSSNNSPQSSSLFAPMPVTPWIKPTQLNPSLTFDVRNRHSSPKIFPSSAEPKSCPGKCQTDRDEDNSKGSCDKFHRMLNAKFTQKFRSKICADLFRVREEQSRPLMRPRTEIPTRPDSPLLSGSDQELRFQNKKGRVLSNLPKPKSPRNPLESKSPQTPKDSISANPILKPVCEEGGSKQSSNSYLSISPNVEPQKDFSSRQWLLRSHSRNQKYLPTEDTASPLPSPGSNKTSPHDPISEKNSRPYSTLLPGNHLFVRVPDKTRIYQSNSPKPRSLREQEESKSPQTPKELISAERLDQRPTCGFQSSDSCSYISPKLGSPRLGSPRPWLLRSCSKNKGLPLSESSSPISSPVGIKSSQGDLRSEKPARPDFTLQPKKNQLNSVPDKTKIYQSNSHKNRSLMEPEESRSPQGKSSSGSPSNHKLVLEGGGSQQRLESCSSFLSKVESNVEGVSSSNSSGSVSTSQSKKASQNNPRIYRSLPPKSSPHHHHSSSTRVTSSSLPQNNSPDNRILPQGNSETSRSRHTCNTPLSTPGSLPRCRCSISKCSTASPVFPRSENFEKKKTKGRVKLFTN